MDLSHEGERRERGRARGGEGRREGRRGGRDTFIYFIYLHILQILSYTSTFSSTSIYLHILNIKNMRTNMRPKSQLAPQSVSQSQNLTKIFVNMFQWPWYIQRGSELIKLVSFEGSRERHMGRIILLIGLPIKAWWIAAY